MTVTATRKPKSDYERVRDALAPKIKTQTSENLCTALLAMNPSTLSAPTRIVRGIFEEELINRHPEADAASALWAEDVDGTASHSEVIVAAVLKALASDTR